MRQVWPIERNEARSSGPLQLRYHNSGQLSNMERGYAASFNRESSR